MDILRDELPSDFRLGHPKDAIEIAQTWSRDDGLCDYRNTSLSELQTRFSRFARYPNGGICLWHRSELAAGFELWPVCDDVYWDLRESSVGTHEVPPDFIFKADPRQPACFWVLASVFVAPRYRNTWVLPALLARGLRQWYCSGHVTPFFRVLAEKPLCGGEPLLSRLGFHSITGNDRRFELQANLGSYEQYVQNSIGRSFGCQDFAVGT